MRKHFPNHILETGNSGQVWTLGKFLVTSLLLSSISRLPWPIELRSMIVITNSKGRKRSMKIFLDGHFLKSHTSVTNAPWLPIVSRGNFGWCSIGFLSSSFLRLVISLVSLEIWLNFYDPLGYHKEQSMVLRRQELQPVSRWSFTKPLGWHVIENRSSHCHSPI